MLSPLIQWTSGSSSVVDSIFEFCIKKWYVDRIRGKYLVLLNGLCFLSHSRLLSFSLHLWRLRSLVFQASRGFAVSLFAFLELLVLLGCFDVPPLSFRSLGKLYVCLRKGKLGKLENLRVFLFTLPASTDWHAPIFMQSCFFLIYL